MKDHKICIKISCVFKGETQRGYCPTKFAVFSHGLVGLCEFNKIMNELWLNLSCCFTILYKKKKKNCDSNSIKIKSKIKIFFNN